jgi:hypothetical protein
MFALKFAYHGERLSDTGEAVARAFQSVFGNMTIEEKGLNE